jgi:Fe-S-cluster-containing dehydrogenase component
VDEETGAVLVSNEKCTACGLCIDACPGKVPYLHPDRKHVVICDLCGGDPQCATICERAGYFSLFRSSRSPRREVHYRLYAKNPEEITANLVINLYGEKGEEFI